MSSRSYLLDTEAQPAVVDQLGEREDRAALPTGWPDDVRVRIGADLKAYSSRAGQLSSGRDRNSSSAAICAGDGVRMGLVGFG